MFPSISVWSSAKLPELFGHCSLRGFSPDNTNKFEWAKISSVGRVADFCSVLQDSQDLLLGSQFNFIIYKYKHYRWQKRILQVTSKTLTFEAM